MREDMFKVIVGRPRVGSRAKNAKIRFLKDDDCRKRVSGRRLAHDQMGTKWLNENLAPLKRFLFKQRGRKWDDVFSEICKHLDTGSTVKMHVREHLDDFVMVKVRIDENGDYWGCHGWGPEPPIRWWTDLYVCPKDGCLKETTALYTQLGLEKPKRFRRTTKKPPESLKILSDTHYLVRKKGIWYEVKTDVQPKEGNGFDYSYGELNKVLFDAIPFRPGPGQTEIWIPQRWSVVSKKQLSKKELKKHGLKNGGDDV